MALTARVLIVARDEALAGPLALGLDRLGWRSVTARGVHAATLALSDLPVEAAVVAIPPGHETDALDAARRLKAARAPGVLPVLALGRAPAGTLGDPAFDLVLAPPLEPARAAQRLTQLVRSAVAAEELDLRLKTFAGLRAPLEPPAQPEGAVRVLAIGEPAPKFLGLSHALTALGAEVVGAFTPYTAFDYLHDRSFDAVVLWGSGDSQNEALSIASGIRRNSRLYHLPTLLYLRSSAEVNLADAFRRGLSDVAAADTAEGETALRIIALARSYRRDASVRRALELSRGSGLCDPATGLFPRDLFAAHLARLAAWAGARRRPLSLAVLRIAADASPARRPPAVDALTHALPQIGAMVARLVRAEDTAARLSADAFALALPNARGPEARTAAERVAAVIACTAFQGGAGQLAFTVEMDVGVAELKPGEPPAQAFERAAAGAGPARRAG